MRKISTLLLLTLCTLTVRSQDVVLDFTQNDWNLPTGKTTAAAASPNSYNNGTLTIQMNGEYMYNSSGQYLMMYGKSGNLTTLTLPAFSSDVEKIEVVGNEGASSSVKMNILVGKTEVSTATTGVAEDKSPYLAKTNAYMIADGYQAAGNIYKVQNMSTGANAQITSIKVYFKGSSQPEATTTTTSFGDDVDGATYVVNEGGTFASKTATVTPSDAVGTLAYTSSDTDVATVDAATGEVTLVGNGTTTITATFTPTDATAYTSSAASYTLRYIATEYVTSKTVTFDATTDKAEGTSITKDGVTVSMTGGNLNLSSGYYSLYANQDITVSTTTGHLVQIEYDRYVNYASDFKLTGDGYTEKDAYTGIWMGKAETVTLTNAKPNYAPLSKIIVTLSFIDDIALGSASNAETIASAMNKVSNVTIDRTFTADGGWYTLCLPFNVDEEQMENVLAGAAVLEFDAMEGTTMKFKNAKGITAGRAYLVLPSQTIESPTFDEVTITSAAPEAATGDYAFIGTLNPTDLATDGTNLFLGSTTSLLYTPTASDYTLGALRAYFQVPGTTAAKLNLNVEDALSIGIVSDTAERTSKVYNLQGMLMGQSLQGLRPGLYIQNGRKVVVR